MNCLFQILFSILIMVCNLYSQSAEKQYNGSAAPSSELFNKVQAPDNFNLAYDLELFPGKVFNGWYYYCSNRGTATTNFQINHAVWWLSISPTGFTSTSCSDIVPIAYSLVAPQTPDVYTATIQDLNGNWPNTNVTLTVTENPTSAQISNTFSGTQIRTPNDVKNKDLSNTFKITSARIDTLFSDIIGSTIPSLDSSGGNVTNGDFTIERSGNDPITGNGIDEITRWNFTYANPGVDSSSEVISALLTLIVEQKDAGAGNDFVQGDNCGCSPINVGLHPLNSLVTIEFEMLNNGYQSQVFIDHIMSNGFPMFYQDDAIVSLARLILIISTNVTSVEEPLVLNEFKLLQNYPNPFNPSTKISWQSPVSGWQTLKVYDVLGNEVVTLVDEYKPAGQYQIEFNASQLSSGVYLYTLRAGKFFQTQKMILTK